VVVLLGIVAIAMWMRSPNAEPTTTASAAPPVTAPAPPAPVPDPVHR
jgi:hypothetical protein